MIKDATPYFEFMYLVDLSFCGGNKFPEEPNKRTAMFGCIAFLQRNRIYIDNNSNILSSLALGSAKHEISLEEIGKTLEKLSLDLKKEFEKNNETTFKR